jgi:hypothetical protein
MRRHEIIGTGVAIRDYEDDRLALDVGHAGITSIARAAGVETIRYGTNCAFEYAGTAADDEATRWQHDVDVYRASAGRQFPPVYRFRVVLEAEELSEDEARAWWEARQAAALGDGGGR